MIGSGNISFPYLEPTTSGLACSLQGARGSEGVYRKGIWVSNQADHLIICVKLPVCDWAAAKGIYSPWYYHITTGDIGVIEKQELFFDHNWLSMWLDIQLYSANCSILIEICYNWFKLKATCDHWMVWSVHPIHSRPITDSIIITNTINVVFAAVPIPYCTRSSAGTLIVHVFPNTVPMWGESIGDWWIPLTSEQY